MPIGVPVEVVAALIESRRLSPGEALDRRLLAHALSDIATAWARQWTEAEK